MNKDNNVRSDNIPARLKVLAEEFAYKVNYDFGSILFLGLKHDKTLDLSRVELEISAFSGYKRHRNIHYGGNICHIYVEFASPAHCIEARNYYISQDDYDAETTDKILKHWYAYEMATYPGYKVSYDIKAVLSVGMGQFDLLSEDLVYAAIKRFGSPKILGVRNCSYLLAFSSMAEGMAACIIHGQWTYMKSKRPLQPYRIQLERSYYLARLLRPYNVESSIDEAFSLEYFLSASWKPSLYDEKVSNASRVSQDSHVGKSKQTREFVNSRGGNRNQRGGRSQVTYSRSTPFMDHWRRCRAEKIAGQQGT